MRSPFLAATALACCVTLLSVAQAEAASANSGFSDVSAANPAYDAIQYLHDQGILNGYADGTFHPNAVVTRAEALKMIMASAITSAQLGNFKTSPFADVPAGSWYLPYVEAARQQQYISGPPSSPLFHPDQPITKASFFKIFLSSQHVGVQSSYSEITDPLSNDVTDSTAWYYPSMRYAITASMTMIDAQGNLSPSRQITRGDVALFMYRYLMYKAGRRTQALLSEAETDIVNVIQMFDTKDIDQAARASARSVLATRGALAIKPDDPLVKGAVKVAQGFQSLVLAYRAGSDGKLQDVLTLTSTAWHLADQAQQFSATLQTVASQMQTIAKSMADEARQLQGQSTSS